VITFVIFILKKTLPLLISSPDPKGHVRYCHHLAYALCIL